MPVQLIDSVVKMLVMKIFDMTIVMYLFIRNLLKLTWEGSRNITGFDEFLLTIY